MKPLLWIIVGPAIVAGSFVLTNIGIDYFVDPAERATPQKQAPSLALLKIDPEEMKACEPARVGKVRWNVSRSGDGAVSIFIAVSKTQETIFAESPNPIGQVDTGQWLGPGTTFVLRQPSSGKELARAEVKLQPGTC
jgi:hypothetical protein